MFICVQLEYYSSETNCYHPHLLLQSQCLNKTKKSELKGKQMFLHEHTV